MIVSPQHEAICGSLQLQGALQGNRKACGVSGSQYLSALALQTRTVHSVCSLSFVAGSNLTLQPLKPLHVQFIWHSMLFSSGKLLHSCNDFNQQAQI